MVARYLRGKNPNTGAYGFWVSKPGFDVRSANIMQMAFSSDFVHPKVVVQGTAVVSPTDGVAPFGFGTAPGAAETVYSIGYGTTLATAPAAFMIATASDWTIPLTNNNGGLTYLNNIWHTMVMETCFAATNINDYWPGKVLVKDGASTNNHLRTDWYSGRVVIIPYVDRVEIRINCRSAITVKYLVMQNP